MRSVHLFRKSVIVPRLFLNKRITVTKIEFAVRGCRGVETRQARGIWDFFAPGDEESVVERIYNISFELTHHFDIRPDVDIVAIN